MIIKKQSTGVYGRIMFPLERAGVKVSSVIERHIESVSDDIQNETDALNSKLASSQALLDRVNSIVGLAESMANQKLISEMSEEVYDYGDFECAYDCMVEESRRLLCELKSVLDAKCKDHNHED